MRLTNSEKHKMGVKLVSDYLIFLGHDHFIFGSDSSFDIHIPGQNKSIKIFCNYSRANNIKVPGNFETHERVLYLVVSPTDRNTVGFSCVGGMKRDIEKSMKVFHTPGSPKNIQTEKLGYVGLKKYIAN